MASVTIREAVSGDVEDVCRIAERGWNAAYGEFLPQRVIDAAVSEWYDPDRTLAHIERADVAYLVAVRNGEVVGYLSEGPSDEAGVASLGALYVDPDSWRDGAGTALLAAFETRRRRRGDEQIRFRVLAANAVGTSFYETHGYEVLEETETELFGEPVRERVYAGSI